MPWPNTHEVIFDATCPGANCWSTLKTVTIIGQDDVIADGSQSLNILLTNTVSGDAAYSGLNPGDISVLNTDNETAAISVIPGTFNAGSIYAEGTITSRSFQVVLTAQPTASVTIPILSDNTQEATVSVSSLTFDNVCPGANCWSTARTITVTNVDDFAADGNQNFNILIQPASSADAAYNGVDAPDLNGNTNNDDDTASIRVLPPGPIVTNENGASHKLRISLQTKPAADVTVTFTFVYSGIGYNNVFIGSNGIATFDNEAILNFQIKLYETSNKIQFVYGSSIDNLSTFSATIGIRDTNGFIDGSNGSTGFGNPFLDYVDFPASGSIIEFAP